MAAQLADHLDHDVRAQLNQGRPVIAWIDPSLLFPAVFGCTHAVVIVGLERDTLYYRDPEIGENVAIPWDQFHAAWDRRQRKGVILWKP